MSSYYKVGGTYEVAGSEAEAAKKCLEHYAAGKVPLKCKGSLTFEDFRTANYHFSKIVYQNPDSLFFVDADNDTNPLYFSINFKNEHTLDLDYNYFFLKSLTPQNFSLVEQLFEKSIFGDVTFETGSAVTNPSSYVNTYSFQKNKPENIREIKIRGEAVFDSSTLAKANYCFLTLQVANTIFYPPEEIYSNIRLEGNKIHFNCHRFFNQSYIEENRQAIKKVLQTSYTGHAHVEHELTENTICVYIMKKTFGGFEMGNIETYRVNEEPE